MSVSGVREAMREARLEAAPAVLLVIVVQVGLAVLSDHERWTLWLFPWWSWIVVAVPVVLLLAALLLGGEMETRRHRRLALASLALVVFANGLALASLVGSLLTERPTGPELLIKTMAVWLANVVSFGLALWELDGGGPLARAGGRDRVELQFPQDENRQLAEPGWHPRLVDYVYVSLTNSIAFSPTDAMPLTRRIKLVMALETIVSVAATILVAARAVNVLQ